MEPRRLILILKKLMRLGRFMQSSFEIFEKRPRKKVCLGKTETKINIFKNVDIC